MNPGIASAGTPTLPKKRSTRVGPGSVFAIPTPVKHDLVNIGKETLRAVAFLAAAMFTQSFDNVMVRRRATSPALRIEKARRLPSTTPKAKPRTHKLSLRFRWFTGLCSFAGFGWGAACGCAARNIFVGNRKEFGFSE
jgi:hypothetical protein